MTQRFGDSRLALASERARIPGRCDLPVRFPGLVHHPAGVDVIRFSSVGRRIIRWRRDAGAAGNISLGRQGIFRCGLDEADE